jgi:hypothetical protein
LDADPPAQGVKIARRNTTKLHELATLLPWNWKAAKAIEPPGTG